MNRLISKITIATATTTVSLLSMSSAVFAGEGGVAGAAAFTIDNTGTTPAVTGVAVAAAVGKQDAAAAAYNVPNVGSVTSVGVQNYAYSLGSAGVISIASMGDPLNAEMTGTDDIDLTTPQANTFTSGGPGAVQLGTVSGEDLVQF